MDIYKTCQFKHVLLVSTIGLFMKLGNDDHQKLVLPLLIPLTPHSLLYPLYTNPQISSLLFSLHMT